MPPRAPLWRVASAGHPQNVLYMHAVSRASNLNPKVSTGSYIGEYSLHVGAAGTGRLYVTGCYEMSSLGKEETRGGTPTLDADRDWLVSVVSTSTGVAEPLKLLPQPQSPPFCITGLLARGCQEFLDSGGHSVCQEMLEQTLFWASEEAGKGEYGGPGT